MSRCPISFDENTPEAMRFACFTSRFFAWSRVRALAAGAGCEVKETKAGWFSRNFFITGSVASLNLFVRAVWDDEMLSPSFREWARAQGHN
jgi:hypothetical protein